MYDKAVSVRVLDAPFHIDRPFDYYLPEGLEATRGSLVRVPFGGGNRETLGIVMGASTPSAEVKLKPVHGVLEARYALSDEMLGLCAFLADRYLCTLGDAVRAVTPHVLRHQLTPHIATVTSYELALTHDELASLLEKKGAIRSEGHRLLLSYLAEHGKTERSALLEATGTTPPQIKALSDKGYIKTIITETIRNPYAHLARERDTSPIHLSRAQMAAHDTILALYEEKKAKCALLHGVTGSGKTKVMLSLIDRAIADGKGVILMVPEIALTPQTVRIFCSRYGERVAVIHSSLTQGERFDAWRRIAEGDVDLVIGTRSAVFAPLANLGLIIIDEEHEHTYKSEQDPKYSTREVAAWRAGRHQALLLLASATPSFESYYKASRGDYTLVPLSERYGGACLPTVSVVDMRKELKSGNTSPISRPLYDALTDMHARGESAILFLNRRGYNASLQCKSCGEVLTCPHCSVALTYHTDRGARLLCHLCGHGEPVPRTCPSCGEGRISYVGFGTQKVESELAQSLNGARVLRMDADTTATRQDYEAMLDTFREGGADILLGTQMVTKGHDFPSVTLVGVMLADMGLHINDFRASERTFSLLTQVIGRAGRAALQGEAMIQTFTPDSEVIRLAKEQDYVSFYSSEIALRKEMHFPPFCDIVELTFSSPKEEKAKTATQDAFDRIRELTAGDYHDVALQVFGPMEANVYKISEQYRLRLLAKCRWNARTRDLFRTLLREGWEKRQVSVNIDINPLHA